MSCVVCEHYKEREINLRCEKCTLQQDRKKLNIRDKTKLRRLKQLIEKNKIEDSNEFIMLQLYMSERNLFLTDLE